MKRDSLTILIVEDEDDIAEMMDFELSRKNHRVTRVKDGVEALDATRAAIPDVIILDIIMPKMDGITFLAELEKIRDDIPIIVVSGAYAARARNCQTILPIIETINKPFSVKRLTEIIDTLTETAIITLDHNQAC